MGKKTFTLRLDSELHSFLEEEAERNGITKNDYIRNLLKREKENPPKEIECTFAEFLKTLKDFEGSVETLNENVDALNQFVNAKKEKK
ncbi:MAG: type II toxin-antitoxin system HicB family antitoxin [Clostridia bacterium]|nr:type II toxin-antitoxin system HicB family antitoxin [Clostridia bacterium]